MQRVARAQARPAALRASPSWSGRPRCARVSRTSWCGGCGPSPISRSPRWGAWPPTSSPRERGAPPAVLGALARERLVPAGRRGARRRPAVLRPRGRSSALRAGARRDAQRPARGVRRARLGVERVRGAAVCGRSRRTWRGPRAPRPPTWTFCTARTATSSRARGLLDGAGAPARGRGHRGARATHRRRAAVRALRPEPGAGGVRRRAARRRCGRPGPGAPGHGGAGLPVWDVARALGFADRRLDAPETVATAAC